MSFYGPSLFVEWNVMTFVCMCWFCIGLSAVAWCHLFLTWCMMVGFLLLLLQCYVGQGGRMSLCFCFNVICGAGWEDILMFLLQSHMWGRVGGNPYTPASMICGAGWELSITLLPMHVLLIRLIVLHCPFFTANICAPSAVTPLFALICVPCAEMVCTCLLYLFYHKMEQILHALAYTRHSHVKHTQIQLHTFCTLSVHFSQSEHLWYTMTMRPCVLRIFLVKRHKVIQRQKVYPELSILIWLSGGERFILSSQLC